MLRCDGFASLSRDTYPGKHSPRFGIPGLYYHDQLNTGLYSGWPRNHEYSMEPVEFGREGSRDDAEWRRDAAGGRGVWRRLWVCCPDCAAIPRGALAKARHPWAEIRNPFGVVVKRGVCVGKRKDLFSTDRGIIAWETLLENGAREEDDGFASRIGGQNPGEHSLKLGTPGLNYGRPLAFKTKKSVYYAILNKLRMLQRHWSEPLSGAPYASGVTFVPVGKELLFSALVVVVAVALAQGCGHHCIVA